MRNPEDDPFGGWRHSGSITVRENFSTFCALVTEAERFERERDYDTAAIYADIAADYAFSHHPGVFASSRLEQLLARIAGNCIPPFRVTQKKEAERQGSPQRILHVATGLTPIGGITSLIWRWIKQDSDRCHSFVMTRQVKDEVPEYIRKAVADSGGRIHRLNRQAGGVISWAVRLRQISAAADLVVLHTSTYDVIPLLAFAGVERPPVIYINHADHVFSLGVSTSDVLANLRESGLQLSQQRRGVVFERNQLLPTPVDPRRRVRQRTTAKRQLGLPEDSIVLLSVARKVKFRTVDGLSYADVHLPLLEKHKHCLLITVGSGVQEDWPEAVQRAQGRILALAEQEKPDLFYEAADIYVDSFPFVSNTSLLEAGSYGLPLVSRYPFPPGCEVLGADMPGLAETLIRVGNIDEYTAALVRLVEDENYRMNLGDLTRKNICESHVGVNWQRSLEELYCRAIGLPRNRELSSFVDELRIEELDMFMPYIHNTMCDGRVRELPDLLRSRLRVMPLAQCARHWFNLSKGRGVGRWVDGMPYMVPEWVLCRTRALWKGFLSDRLPAGAKRK